MLFKSCAQRISFVIESSLTEPHKSSFPRSLFLRFALCPPQHSVHHEL